MKWSFSQRAELFCLAEAGRLDAAQFAAARAIASLRPGQAEWQAMLARLLALGGVLLLGAGLVFFFASNWDALHRFAKLAVAFAAFLAAVVVALGSAAGSLRLQAALFAVNLATGALFALIGQIYQSGADPWQLFALWAALILPLVVAGRGLASWLLWLALANVAVLLAWSRARGWGLDPFLQLSSLVAAAVLNLSMLAVAEFGQRLLLPDNPRFLPRCFGVSAVLVLSWAAILGCFALELRPALSLFVAAFVCGVAVYGAWRRDLVLLGVQLYGAIGVLAAGLASRLGDADFFDLLVIAMVVAIGSAAAGWWLLRLHRRAGEAC